MTDIITITKPDDWHLHVRDDDMMRASLPYTTAKFALLGLARSLAVELAGRRIRVNCVSPGFAETSLTSHIDPRLKEMIARSVPLKRLASPDEIASAVAFLLNPENGYLTGINLPVTGGGAM